MKYSKEKQQTIMLAIVLGLISAVLLYYFHDRFLPRPVGEPVVLTPPRRLQVPSGLTDASKLYERADFQALQDHVGIPVKPQDLSGSGNPFIEDLKQ